MEKVRIGMVGYKFMGKAHSHAYRDLPLFFPNTVHPEMKVICGRDQSGVVAAAKQFGWEEYTTELNNNRNIIVYSFHLSFP